MSHPRAILVFNEGETPQNPTGGRGNSETTSEQDSGG